MVYLTSDLHFCHDKDFVWKERGFNSIDEMNEAIIANWNATVTEEDIVYILGDLVLNDLEKGLECINRLRAKRIYCLTGNHDTATKLNAYCKYTKIYPIGYTTVIKQGKKSFYLSHYPTMTGNGAEQHAPWCLHGHTHSKDKFEFFDYRCYNCGLDAHNNTPVRLDKIIKDIDERRMVK